MAIKTSVKKIGKLSAIYLAGAATPKVTGLFLLPIFTHYLVPEQFGIVKLALQISQLLAVFVQLGTPASLKSSYFRVAEAERAGFVKATYIGQLFHGALSCLVLSAIGYFFSDALLPNLPLEHKLLFPLWLLIVWSSFLGGFQKLGVSLAQIEERAWLSVSVDVTRYMAQDLAGVLVVVLLGWQGFGRQVTVIFGLAVAAVLALRLLVRSGRAPFAWSTYADLLRRGLTFVPHSLAGVLSLTVNTWILNKLASTAEVGIYGIAVQFAQFLEMPLFSLGNAAYPTLAKLMNDGGPEARREQSRLYTLTIVGAAGLALCISVLAPVAIDLLADEKFHGAKLLTTVLVAGFFFQGLYIIGSHVVFYFGGGLTLSTATASSVVANGALCLLLVPRYGMLGAAYAMVGSFVLRAAIVIAVGRRLYSLPWEVGPIVRATLAIAAVAAADVLATAGLGLVPGLLVKVALLASVVPLLLGMRVITVKEIRELGRLIQRHFPGGRRGAGPGEAEVGDD